MPHGSGWERHLEAYAPEQLGQVEDTQTLTSSVAHPQWEPR